MRTRLPSRSEVRQRQRRRRIISAVVLAVLVAGSPWWSVWLSEFLAGEVMAWNAHFRVNHVTVSGTQVLYPDAVTALANVPHRHSMFTLPLGAIAARVRQDPWVKSVRVVRRLPDTVELIVTERRPMAAVRGEKLMVLTADSVAISPPPQKWVWNLPLITPPRSVKFENGKRITDKTALLLLHQAIVARSVSEEVWANISEVYCRGTQTRAMLNAPPVEIILGESVNELAWIGLLHYLRQTSVNAPQTAVTSIDLRFPGKLVVASELPETTEHVTG